LADKKCRQTQSPIVVVVNETKVINNKPKPATNKFAQLYSSDEEEVEEGEIVEDLSVRFASLNSDISSCDSDYSCENGTIPERGHNGSESLGIERFSGETTQEVRIENEDRWNRSGVKNVFIPQVHIEQKEEECEPCYCKPNFEYYDIPGGEEILMYIEKMRGMSWADIECDSDFE
jgi:hypothetical protein